MSESLWWQQQREVTEHTWERGRFLLWDPRCGKTRPIVLEIAHWIAIGVRRILVVAPLDGCKVWLKDDELGRFDPERVAVIDLSADLPIAQRAAAVGMLNELRLPTVVVVNRDVIFKEHHRKDGSVHRGLQLALVRWGVEAIVIDEFHDFRKVSSKRTRAALAIARNARFRRGLSGTPDPTSYIDYYAPFKVIAPEVFGTRLDDFKARYCIMSQRFPNRVDRYINVEELQAKIFSVSTRVKQEDCFDMPEVLPDAYIDVPFTKLARELYDELTANLCAEFLGVTIDATHQLAKLAILHQLAAGFIRDEHGNPEWVFDGKIKAAHRYIAEMMRADKRIVVYHHYRPEGERLEAECVSAYGRDAVGSLHGKTPRSARSAHPFLDRPAMRVFIAQEDTASVSISLRESDHVLWYSWGPESDVNYQARQRIFDERATKPHGLSYTFLNVPKTADQFMTKVVKTKRDKSEMLLDYGFKAAAFGTL